MQAGTKLNDASLEHRLAEIVASVRFSDLPSELVSTMQLFALDTLGVIGGAARAPGISELLLALGDLGATGCATVLLDGSLASPEMAAFVNAAAAHSLDFDDQHDPARIHAFCVVLPTVLATAQAKNRLLVQAFGCSPAHQSDGLDLHPTFRPVTGPDFLRATALGVEIFSRLGLACPSLLNTGWHPTTLLGCIAGAASSSAVLGLDTDATHHAMALAYAQASGTNQPIHDGALAKRIGPGFAARSAVTAAFLARRGITGPTRYLTGTAGLFQLYGNSNVRTNILDNIGLDWETLRLSMKPFPCCRCTHTVTELGQSFRSEGLRSDEIESGVIELSDTNVRIVGSKFDQNHPQPTVHAQFNAAYAFANALDRGVVGIGDFSAESVRRPAVAWASKVSTVPAADMDPSAVAPARVRLRLKNGNELVKVLWTMKGSPENRLTVDEIRAKFADCLRYGFGSSERSIDGLINLITTLEGCTDLEKVIQAFARARSSQTPRRRDT